jgi:hypothetical protein
MKFLFFVIFNLCAIANLHSQNCRVLEKEQFFKSIGLGDKISINLIECLRPAKFEYSYYKDYRVSYDSLSEFCKKKYADIFKFQFIPFSYSSIRTNKKDQIIQIELYHFFGENIATDSAVIKEPEYFTKMLDELKLKYGDPTKVEEKESKDSPLVKEVGVLRVITWECNNIILELRVNYGSKIKELNMLDIQIRNELIEPTELLQ